MNDTKSDYTLKILTIGESGVGKTCILLRYTDNKFIKTHLTTIGKI
jgi:GTPase SAR1 family protein